MSAPSESYSCDLETPCCELGNSNFDSSDLTGANLSNADLTNTTFNAAMGTVSSDTGATYSNTTCQDGSKSDVSCAAFHP